MGLNFSKMGMTSGNLNIFAEEPAEEKSEQKKEEAAPVVHTESEFLYRKKITCPVCGDSFEILAPVNTKLKRLEPDFDLRPRFEYIDTVKYDVISCTECGYSAMTSTFASIDTARMKLIRQEICAYFSPENPAPMNVYTYDYAIDKFKLALVNTIKKRGKMAEKAYCCLKIAWLRRAQLDAMKEAGVPDKAKLAEIEEDYKNFYQQAYEGFMKAMETETPPFCGLDTITVEFMTANMAMEFGQLSVAAKIVARLLTSPGVSPRIKDKCLDLKEEITKKAKAQ